MWRPECGLEAECLPAVEARRPEAAVGELIEREDGFGREGRARDPGLLRAVEVSSSGFPGAVVTREPGGEGVARGAGAPASKIRVRSSLVAVAEARSQRRLEFASRCRLGRVRVAVEVPPVEDRRYGSHARSMVMTSCTRTFNASATSCNRSTDTPL